ncbi:MAG: PLDc N-terminal domain-containing protein [Desulfobacula sp.]|nr:PLDc N-terminal domain-containing protein [Desulfobacula sp.]MDA8134157.1 PLDc N-terminal domain-containing protein [Desulfobacteraceae bacterium]
MDQLLIYILLVFAASFLLTMMALRDIILKDFGSTKAKFIWHFIAIVPLVGWLVYLVFGYKKGRRKPI